MPHNISKQKFEELFTILFKNKGLKPDDLRYFEDHKVDFSDEREYAKFKKSMKYKYYNPHITTKSLLDFSLNEFYDLFNSDVDTTPTDFEDDEDNFE